MDAVPDAANMSAAAGAQFPVLADPDGEVVRAYGVYDLLGDGVAAPATFIITPGDGIRWRQVGQDIADRPTADELLLRLEDLLE